MLISDENNKGALNIMLFSENLQINESNSFTQRARILKDFVIIEQIQIELSIKKTKQK